MGADLYINSLYGPNHASWEPRFEEAVKRRDARAKDSAEAKQLQKEVDRCYENMLARGYFRDPYNSSDVLWKFGLSWWTDVTPLLDKQGYLSVEQARKFQTVLTGRENIFEDSLIGLPDTQQRYFRDRRRELKRFLASAIRRNEPIECSL